MTPEQLEGYIFQVFEKAATRYAPPPPVSTTKSDTHELITRQDAADIRQEVFIIIQPIIFIDLQVRCINKADSNAQQFSAEKESYFKSIISFLTILKSLYESIRSSKGIFSVKKRYFIFEPLLKV